MRCEDVIRELATPTGAVAQEAVTDHLAQCATCSAFARRDAQLQRLWDATRPPMPTTATWDSVWARIADSLDQAAAPHTLPLTAARAPVRTWTTWRVVSGLVKIAAAAAVIVAIAVYRRLPEPQSQPASPTLVTVDIEQGEVMVIQMTPDRKVTTIDLAQNDKLNGDLETLNTLEGIGGDEWNRSAVQ
jgi:hypothetical protein